MTIKRYNPITPSLRETALVDKSSLWKGKPHKGLTVSLSKTGGRNNLGRITSRHIGGGNKRKYRLIDFKRSAHDGIEGVVERIEYDPNRTSFIALIKYDNGSYSYILSPQGLKSGSKIISGEKATFETGNAMLLEFIPVGTFVHNVEIKAGGGGKLVRSAGGFAQVVGKSNNFAHLKLKSGEIRLISLKCRATIGVVSNANHQNVNYGKAGRKRWLGCRPIVRGVAQNPVDHPLGGGEGKTSGGRHPVSPWGQLSKGKKTRHNKRASKFILKRRK